MEAILKSPEFYSAPVYRAGMKTPAEVMVTAIRDRALAKSEKSTSEPICGFRSRRLGRANDG